MGTAEGIKNKKRMGKSRRLTETGREIITEIDKIKEELESCQRNFDLATDDTLIDSYIYEIIALNKKYQYFLKMAKENGLVAGGFENIV